MTALCDSCVQGWVRGPGLSGRGGGKLTRCIVDYIKMLVHLLCPGARDVIAWLFFLDFSEKKAHSVFWHAYRYIK